MKYNISKELFEAVKGLKVKSITVGGFIFFEMEDGYSPNYGICTDTFVFHCKEWALEQGYRLSSGYMKELRIPYCMCQSLDEDKGRWEDYTIFAETEQQAVFDACEYIIKGLIK